MKGFIEENESTWAYVATALLVFVYLENKAEREKRDLVAEIDNEIQGAEKKTYGKAISRMLEELKIELLVPRIVETVAQRFNEALQEAKWTKWLLYISQGFGVAGAGALISNYDKPLSGSLFYLVIYCLGTIFGLLMLFIHGRQKIG